MSKFIQLSILTGLLGLASTLVACGSEVSVDEAAEASSKDLCEHMADKIEDADDQDLEECTETIDELKEVLGDDWEDIAKCLVKAETEDDVEECVKEALPALIQHELKKAGVEKKKDGEDADE